MKPIRSIVAGIGIATLVSVAGAGAASAAPATRAAAATALTTNSTAARYAAPADGYVYAWTEPYRRGGQCRWLGNAATWGGCANNVGSVENRGYGSTLDDVRFYWGAYYEGASACLGRGDMWLDLSIKRERFNEGVIGYGEPLFNNIASHRWVSRC